ncbi:hypothetical protein C8Q75DRAFT_750932 [Abortiporus biennis]|nr:hypothetical protein C8Q75DRAFT_750932 [Abortiporus biennis]
MTSPRLKKYGAPILSILLVGISSISVFRYGEYFIWAIFHPERYSKSLFIVMDTSISQIWASVHALIFIIVLRFYNRAIGIGIKSQTFI